MTVLGLLGILVASACLPNENIKKNVEKSAIYYNECGNDFSRVIKGNRSTILDHYSDSILLGIAYSIDNEHPFKSVVSADYYRDNMQRGFENLSEQVLNKQENNTSYERYWHGSLIWVRFLLLFTDIKGIYIINGVLMAILFTILVCLLIKKHAYGLFVAMLLGGITTYSYLAPLALESTWTYLIMLIASIAIVAADNHKKDDYIIPIFIITGVITNFTDFLTAETMTLTMPLIVFAYLKKSDYNLKRYIKCMGAWLLAYCAMWFTKWCIAAIILNKSIASVAYDSIVLRTVGDKSTLGTKELLKSSFKKNIRALYPLNMGGKGIMIVILLIVIAIYFSIVFQKKEINAGYICSLLVIFCVPYIRYLILHEHSATHYFHTYRAQISTVTVLTLITIEMVNWGIFINKKNKRRRVKK